MYPLDIAVIVETKSIWDELQATLAGTPVRVVLELSRITDAQSFLEKVSNARPDVVLMEIEKEQEGLEDIVKAVRGTSTSPFFFALHPSQNPEIILKALRAGATEFLAPPFGDPLKQALERVSTERARKQHQSGRSGGHAIGFISAKGGCGATTLACHTSVRLGAQSGQKVLLADFDMDAAMVGFVMKSKSPYTILDALRDVQRLDTNFWHALVSNGIPNLEILTGPQAPASVRAVGGDQIRYVMRFVREQYDWLVLDLGRGLSEFTLRSIEELDELYIVTTLEIPALHQAKVMIERLGKSGYNMNRLRLVVNRSPKRSELTADDIKKMLGLPVFSTISDDPEALHESFAEGKLVASGTSVARQFDDLSMKILKG